MLTALDYYTRHGIAFEHDEQVLLYERLWVATQCRIDEQPYLRKLLTTLDAGKGDEARTMLKDKLASLRRLEHDHAKRVPIRKIDDDLLP